MKTRISSAGAVASVARLGGHELTFDQPLTTQGGTDRGPSPLDVLAVSVGACAHYYAAAFLHARGRETGALTVDVEWHKDKSPVPRIGRLVIAVHLPADIGDRDRASIERAVKACPAYGTLRYPPVVAFEIGAGRDPATERLSA